MRIRIRARDGELTKALVARVERRLAFALARFGDRIATVLVTLWDHGEPADEKRCQIEVGLRPARKLKVEGVDGDLLAATDRASERVASAVARVLDSERDLDRLLALPPRVEKPRRRKPSP
jgi:ribosome-associated translation inhibitor RaiA